MIRRGDLVLDADGRYALILDVHGDGRCRLGRDDGTVVDAWLSDRTRRARPAANFAALLRSDRADPPPPEES